MEKRRIVLHGNRIMVVSIEAGLKQSPYYEVMSLLSPVHENELEALETL